MRLDATMLEHRPDEAFLRNPSPSFPELGSEALVQLAGRERLLRQVRADDHAPAELAAVKHVARGRRSAHLLKRHDDLAQAGRLRLARRRGPRDEHLLHYAELRAQGAGLTTEPFSKRKEPQTKGPAAARAMAWEQPWLLHADLRTPPMAQVVQITRRTEQHWAAACLTKNTCVKCCCITMVVGLQALDQEQEHVSETPNALLHITADM